MNPVVKRIFRFSTLLLSICLAVGMGLFLYGASSFYTINSHFQAIPLQFDPDQSTSTFQFSNTQVVVHDGFVKGWQKLKDKSDALVIRALGPLPTVEITNADALALTLIIENINPEFYARSLNGNGPTVSKTSANALSTNISAAAGQGFQISPDAQARYLAQSDPSYIIMGDNRDGYATFEQIIARINSESPIFVVDNGDLVFSGKPNQYRLFDQMASGITSTLCTAPGNHDIRGNGRSIYTMLYGPAYYAFDYAGTHFIFLDSSRGWAEKESIPKAQYAWLERDLKRAQGKRIFVISHIPPHDPRTGTAANEIPNFSDQVKSGESWVERKLDQYTVSKLMNHGFQDPAEADQFEKLMSTYHVDTVYLSHIHSYLEYTKDGVRYLISGGAGAELLSENSYYHYLLVPFVAGVMPTRVELSSPANSILVRYAETAKLFALAIYRENPVAVVLILAGLILLGVQLGLLIYFKKQPFFNKLVHWLSNIVVFAIKDFSRLFMNKHPQDEQKHH